MNEALKQKLSNTVRFSLSVFTTEEEIDLALSAVGELLPVLRRFSRR